MKKVKSILLVALVVASSCVSACFAHLEKPIVNSRDYEPFQERAYPAPTMYVQVYDSNIAYIEKGEGSTVILVHGGVIPRHIPWRKSAIIHFGAVSTIDTWQYNFDEFAKYYHVVALDLPGFGSSEKPDINYRVEDFTRYLYGFMEAKGIEKASIIGHDLGGLIAMDLSLTYPEKVESLVLISPYGTVKYPFPFSLINFSHYPRPVARIYQKEKAALSNILLPVLKRNAKGTYKKILHRESPDIIGATDARGFRPKDLLRQNEGNAKEFIDQTADYKFKYIKTKEFSDELHATHLALIDVGRYDWWHILLMNPEERTDWVTRVKNIKAPTLIIWGKYNPRLARAAGTIDEAEYLDRAISNSVVSVFESSAHYPMVEETEKFNKDVLVFLKGAAP